MWKALVLGILVFALSDVSLTQTDSKEAAPKKNILKSTNGCEQFYGGGNATKVYVITTASAACPGARMFEIQWSGSTPPHNLKYRSNGAYLLRDVLRRDTTGIIVSDTLATMGIGAPVRVTTQIRHNGGQDALYLVNTTLSHAFAEFEISAKQNGVEVTNCKGMFLVDPVGTPVRWPVCAYPSDAQLTIVKLNAEADTD